MPMPHSDLESPGRRAITVTRGGFLVEGISKGVACRVEGLGFGVKGLGLRGIARREA